MNQPPERIYEFGPFRVDALKRRLLREGEVVCLTSKVFDTLLVLVERRGEVLSKDELMRRLWPDTVVEENNLTQQISALRKALGERAHEGRYVVTVPGRGYSFVASVREVTKETPDLILEQHTRSLITIDVEDDCDEKNASARAVASRHIHGARRTFRTRHTFLSALIACALVAFAVAYVIHERGERARQTRTADAATPKSIAVLPFKSLNADAGDAILGAGMSDTLIAKLSNLRQINVRPTSAVMKYASSNADALSAGRELGVDSVLEGTIQRSGERVRVTVQLLSVSNGTTVWAQSFDEKLTDIFDVQDAISEQVARAVSARIGGDERQNLRKHHTESVQAYEAYLRGRYFWEKRNEEGLRKSVGYFRQAVELDPEYALAYAGMADAYNLLVGYGLAETDSQDCAARARAAATRALEIDETLPEAHASLGSIALYYDADTARAETEFRRAIELNPSYATAHHWLSDCLAMSGRQEEAMAEIVRAHSLDPLSPIINTTLAERLYYSRRYDEAVERLRRTLEVEPDLVPARFILGLAYEQKGMYEEAIAELRKANELSGRRLPVFTSALGHTYALAGRRGEARKVLNELFRLDYHAPYEIATVYTALGEKRRAIEWLQRIHTKKSRWLLETDPRLDSLRSDPKFQDLLRA
jgi:DNA-binding winged helix-turn-helix (wHTH) protein/TolB-like protein/Flp pilus assembly protein TadD